MSQDGTQWIVPAQDDLNELVMCARYGQEEDIADMRHMVSVCGPSVLSTARDAAGNTCLHVAGANNHLAVLDYILPQLERGSFAAVNDAGSTPLHWMAMMLNGDAIERLAPYLQPDDYLIKDGSGRTPVEVAQKALDNWLGDTKAPQPPPNGEAQVDFQAPVDPERASREKVVAFLLNRTGDEPPDVRPEGDRDDAPEGGENGDSGDNGGNADGSAEETEAGQDASNVNISMRMNTD